MKVAKAKAGASVPAAQKVKAAMGGMMMKPMDKKAMKAMKDAKGKAKPAAKGKKDMMDEKKIVGAYKGGMAKKKGC